MYARANAAVLTSAEIEQCIKSTILGEVYTTPKPGLVDRHDNGAHHDMNVYTFERSADAITPYLAKMFFEGYFWKRNLQNLFPRIRRTGVLAEKAMFRATGQVNTHKGLIFTMGILSACAGHCYARIRRFDTAEILASASEMTEKALEADPSYTEGTAGYLEILASTMFPINPPDTETDPTGATGMFDSFYAKETNEDDIPESFMSVLQAHASDLAYFSSEERAEYRAERAEDHAAIFLAVNMTEDENVENILAALASFGVTKEKYDSFNYKYDPLKALAFNTVVTYRGRIAYETEVLDKSLARGEITAEEYKAQLTEKTAEVTGDITDSLLASLPQGVSDALKEIGQADLYTLIVGSIFYKLAGLLLPIIYMIMASNNLVAGQVDSGSMAYVLSTSTKRKTVVFTQAVYLIGSLFTMFCLTTITGCVCLAIVKTDVTLTYGKLLLLNAGAFLVLFALSGLCFFTSCWFDRSKRSMAIGGGLSIFALVAAMLGLFGSPVIPSVVRMDSLNYFNKVTIISFFDVISIMDGTKVFLWKFAILAVLGILGYLAGSVRFTKKDLPL